jgi:hypothetical protein
MKLKHLSIVLCALSILSFIKNANAQVAIPNGVQITPELIERGKGMAAGFSKKFGKKAVMEAAKRAMPFVIPTATAKLVLQPKKTLATAAVLAAGGGAALWWYSTTVPYAVKKLAKDPTDFEVYWDNLADDFDKKLDFAQTAWDLYYENTGEEQKKYEDLIVLLGYERPSLINDLVNPVMINPKTKVEQEDLEKTNDFTLAMAQVDALATQMDLQYEPLCKGKRGQQIREQLYKLTPKDFAQLPLVKSNTNTVQFLNVDSYGELKAKLNLLERDHIPSYAALEKKFAVTAFNNKGKKIRVENLEVNASAISLPYKMHRNNRTTGKVNSKLSILDMQNLKAATLWDFATLLAMKKLDIGKWETNKIDYNDLLNSFSFLYGRNAQLCLYY